MKTAEMEMELALFRARDHEQRLEIEALREDRALLAGRNDRLERDIMTWRGMMLNSIAPPRVFAEYAPGILHAVPDPAAPRVVDTGRAMTSGLPSPADRMMKALLDPNRHGMPWPIDELARHLRLAATGGHYKRGLVELQRRDLVIVDGKEIALKHLARQPAMAEQVAQDRID